MSEPAMIVEGVARAFGDVRALCDVDFRVAEGSVVALVGPNGAGKTTMVRILTTLLAPDSGRAIVAGYDVVAQAPALRQVIGLAGQNAAVDQHLTGRENLEMVGRLYHLTRTRSRSRAGELLEQFDLTDAAERQTGTYSGGMRRRLDLAASLVNQPRVLFLDEPTTGLDPRSRIALWKVIEELVDGGTTLLLTTQYLEEADHLADQIVVVDHGTVIADASPDELKARVGGSRLVVAPADPGHREAARAALARMSEEEPTTEGAGVSIPAPRGAAMVAEAVRLLDAAGVDIADIGIRRPSLDDVFLSLTGRAAVGSA